MQLPETRTMIHEVRETRISTMEDKNNDADEGGEDNEDETPEKIADGDLV